MRVREVAEVLEKIAPLEMAADWDNVGLLVGDESAEVSKAMLCIDLTGPVLEEALRAKAQMVVAYHPVIFKPLQRLTGSASPVAWRAVRENVSVYSPHTALDAAPGGTNDVLAEAMGLEDAEPLEDSTDSGQCKIVVFVPAEELSGVAEAAFEAGAGRMGTYRDCAFFTHGIGTFLGLAGANPTTGTAGRHEADEEVRLEVVAPRGKSGEVCRAIHEAHSYEMPVVDVYPIEAPAAGFGMGRVGRLARPVTEETLIRRLKKAGGCRKVLIARPPGSPAGGKGGKVHLAACCAGSCGDRARLALAKGATFYVTGEMRHHDALALAAEGMTCVCMGHSNSERMTLAVLAGRLREALQKLEVALSKRDKDPFEII